MLPEAITMLIFAPIAGLLYDKIGARWPAVIGLLIVACSSYLMSSITWDVSREAVMVWTSLRSVGYVLAIVPVLTLGIATARPGQADEANAWNNLTYRVTAALALSVLNTIAASLTAQLAVDYAPRRTALPLDMDPRTLLSLYEHFLVRVQARVMGELFFIMTLVTLAGALLALALPTGRPSTASTPTADQTETTNAAPRADPPTSVKAESAERWDSPRADNRWAST